MGVCERGWLEKRDWVGANKPSIACFMSKKRKKTADQSVFRVLHQQRKRIVHKNPTTQHCCSLRLRWCLVWICLKWWCHWPRLDLFKVVGSLTSFGSVQSRGVTDLVWFCSKSWCQWPRLDLFKVVVSLTSFGFVQGGASIELMPCLDLFKVVGSLTFAAHYEHQFGCLVWMSRLDASFGFVQSGGVTDLCSTLRTSIWMPRLDVSFGCLIWICSKWWGHCPLQHTKKSGE